MDIVNQHLDILQNIEVAVILYFQENPALKDQHVLDAYEKLATRYDRQKRKLPELPVFLDPLSKGLFDNIWSIAQIRTSGSPTESLETANVLPGVMLMCINRLIKSVKLWNKENGSRGYLTYCGQFIG